MRRLWVWLAVVSAGCATAADSPSAADGGKEDQRLAELSRLQNDQARRIAELEARLTLLESDARRARGPTTRPSATVRIGEHEGPGDGEEDDAVTNVPIAAAPNHAVDRRPNLKLQGRARGRIAEASGELPPLPVTSETLPVVPLPQDRSRTLQVQAKGDTAAGSDPATATYRGALRALRERRFDEAALALSNWVSDNPKHALLDRAMYWLGEVRYASRNYREALVEFEKVLQRFPNSDKTPDTLYKLAMCWRRLGAEERAREYFKRLRSQFPNSEAAGLASREGST
jgi:tol-pal system protein YbgF